MAWKCVHGNSSRKANSIAYFVCITEWNNILPADHQNRRIHAVILRSERPNATSNIVNYNCQTRCWNTAASSSASLLSRWPELKVILSAYLKLWKYFYEFIGTQFVIDAKLIVSTLETRYWIDLVGITVDVDKKRFTLILWAEKATFSVFRAVWR